MAEEYALTLELGRQDEAEGYEYGEPQKVLLGAPREFTFWLCQKDLRLGDVSVKQLWMPRSSVTGVGKQPVKNRNAILDHFYWDGCRTLKILNEFYLSSLILAHIHPHSRAYGARRIFLNSQLTKRTRKGLGEFDLLSAIDSQLQATMTEQMSPDMFQGDVRSLLGPKHHSYESYLDYFEFKHQIVVETLPKLLQRGRDELHEPIERWRHWMRTIARSGKKSDRDVLDYISYEASAAYQHAYAVAMSNVLQYYEYKGDLNSHSLMFNRFWHGEQFLAPRRDQQPHDWFQGHVFALHPGAGYFLRTKSGQKLTGDWLKEPDDLARLQQLLHGIYVALCNYRLQFDDVANERKIKRKKRSTSVTSSLDGESSRDYELRKQEERWE